MFDTDLNITDSDEDEYISDVEYDSDIITDVDMDGWTPSHCAWERNEALGYLVYWANSGTSCHEKNYKHYITSETISRLSDCSSATVTYSVMFRDDEYTNDVEKTERLILQCLSSDGSTWVDIKPTDLPSAQTSCKDYYCDGDSLVGKSFSWTDQELTLPAECLNVSPKLRFKAWGSDNWRIDHWGVDTVNLK